MLLPRPLRFDCARPSSVLRRLLGCWALALAAVATPTRSEGQTTPQLIWRAGSGLDAPPVVGPDGAIYIASRQGTLDVIDQGGALRFSINLNGSPTGAIFVDRRGWAYVAMMTGRVVAVNPEGLKQWVFVAPNGIRGDVGFSEGQGLLFREQSGQILGINRAGFPTFRLNPRGHVSAGPIGVLGWCVVATTEGELVWGDRSGKRRRDNVGVTPRELLPTTLGGVWALTDIGLIAYTNRHQELFRREGVVAMATVAAPAASNHQGRSADLFTGAILTADGQLLWLDSVGAIVHRAQLASQLQHPAAPAMSLDGASDVWINVADDSIEGWLASGQMRARYAFPQRVMFRTIADIDRGLNYAASLDGELYRLP